MGKWDNIKFKIVESLSGFVIRGDVTCGAVLSISSKGVRRSLYVGDAFGFDRDASGRVKFFKGHAPTTFNQYLFSSKVVSSLDWSGEQWRLEKSGDIIFLTCGILYVLIITPAGVYRCLNCSGIGLPCDKQGRVMVLK